MKKKIIFICSIVLSLLAGFNANAKIFKENVTDYIASTPLKEGVVFNVMKGMSEGEFADSGYYWNLEDFLWGYYTNGYVDISADLIGDAGLSSGLNARFEVVNTDDISITIDLKGEVFYQAKFNHSDLSYKVLMNNEVDLNKAIGYSKSGYEMQRIFVMNNGEGNEPDQSELEDLGFSAVYGMLYKYEENYSNQRVHFISDISNPLTEQQILDSISVNDFTDGSDIDYHILYSEYDYNNPNIGVYPITICATDNSGNTTLLDAVVDVVAVTSPKITGKDLRCSYYFYHSEQSIKSCFTVECDYEYTLEIINNEYKSYHNKPGNYKVTARATDIYGNSSECTINVLVVDDFPPRVAYSKIEVATANPYTIEDFKAHITVNDDIDGLITDYTLEDIDGYFNNTKRLGDFRLNLIAIDRSGNKTENLISFTVKDTDYPSISVNEFTIVASEDHVITKEEIINVLIKAGQISSNQDVSLISDYFDVENPSGIYSLEVRTSDGVFYDKIEVCGSHEITPSVVKKEKEFNYLFILIPSIIVVLGTLSFVVYKKKH